MENIIDKTHIESVWADLNMVIHMFIHCEIVPYSPSNWKKKWWSRCHFFVRERISEPRHMSETLEPGIRKWRGCLLFVVGICWVDVFLPMDKNDFNPIYIYIHINKKHMILSRWTAWSTRIWEGPNTIKAAATHPSVRAQMRTHPRHGLTWLDG